MSRGTAYGIAFGVCLPLGTAFGVVLDTIGVGVALGAAVAPLVSIAIRQSKIEEWRRSRAKPSSDSQPDHAHSK